MLPKYKQFRKYTNLINASIVYFMLFEFLSGFLGGPQLYFERHRNSNVKSIHAHLEIGSLERDAWLACMNKALIEIQAKPETHQNLMTHFSRIAEALRTMP